MQITIGITTFNRLPYMKKMSNSLHASSGWQGCILRVYDDCSTELAVDGIKCFVSQR